MQESIPTRGRDLANLIIVAAVNNVLHIRIFNRDRKRISGH